MRETYEDTPIVKNMIYFFKWGIVAVLIGMATGVVGTIFGHGVILASGFFRSHPWMIFLLPVSGLLIIGIYRVFGEMKNRGTNMVIEAIYSDTEVSLATTPCIFFSTLLTHLAGGSSGREGAALQMGGSIGNQIGKLLKLDEKDKKIAVMCGMSGAFAALFGTPVAAAVFSMEVISIGVMYYAALVPCLFSAFTGAAISAHFGLHPEAFDIGAVPAFDIQTIFLVVLLGIGCALVSALFCITLCSAEHLYKEYLPSPTKRILSGAVLVILLTLLVGNIDYNGSGMNLIEACFEGEGKPFSFLWKILFTAVTLKRALRAARLCRLWPSERPSAVLFPW